jgi:predicted dehydrogenase
MSELLGVGIIGCGNVAARSHLPAWQDVADLVRVVAVSDPHPDARERLRVLAGLAPEDSYADAANLIARNDVHILNVCTPQAFRRDVLIAGAKAGKHILCEKPLATTPADAAIAVDAANANGVLFGIVHNYLSLAETLVTKQVIESGEIGTIRSVIVNLLGVVYEPGAAGDWRRDPALSGGGVLMDLVHGVYWAESLLGEQILRVSAHIGTASPESVVEDLAMLRMETANRVGLVNIGWGHGPGDTVVTGTKGRVEIRYENGSTAPWANLEHVRVITTDGVRELLGPATERSSGPGDFPSHTRAFKALVREFAHAAHGRGQPISTGTDGLRMLETVMAAYQSAATGQTVSIPLDRTSPAFTKGAAGIAELSSVPWSPFANTPLLRPKAESGMLEQ